MSEEKDVCGCGHDHDHDGCGDDFELDTMYLTLDDDTEMECAILGVFEVDKKEYIALLPIDSDQVLLYAYSEKDEEIQLDTIEDDDLFDKVSSAFYDLYEEDEEE